MRFLSAIATVSMDTLHLDTRSHPVLNVLLWATPPPHPPVCHSLINSELFAFVSTLQKSPQIAAEPTTSTQVYISSAGQFKSIERLRVKAQPDAQLTSSKSSTSATSGGEQRPLQVLSLFETCARASARTHTHFRSTCLMCAV